MGNRGRRWLTAIAVAATLTAACNGDDDADGSPVITDPVESSSSTSSTSSTSSSTTTDPQAEVKAEVETAYLAYWTQYFGIFGAPNPANPLIDELLTGAAREQALDAISEHILNGTSVQPPVNEDDFDATVLSVEVQDDTATVRACVIDGSRVVQNESGEVLNDTLATYLLETTLVHSGSWRLSETASLERREERWSCAT